MNEKIKPSPWTKTEKFQNRRIFLSSKQNENCTYWLVYCSEEEQLLNKIS